MGAYAFNPFHIVRAGYKRFERAIKRRSKYTHFETLRHLFVRAELSARYLLTTAETDLLTRRLQALWADYERHSQRMEELQQEIETLGEALKAAGALPRLDEHVSGVTLFNMARLIGETGPLGDFPSKRALLRYAGLNADHVYTASLGAGRAAQTGPGRPVADLLKHFWNCPYRRGPTTAAYSCPAAATWQRAALHPQWSPGATRKGHAALLVRASRTGPKQYAPRAPSRPDGQYERGSVRSDLQRRKFLQLLRVPHQQSGR